MLKEPDTPKQRPGVCIPWQDKVKELPDLQGNPDLTRQTWENVDALAYTYVWHILVSF